MSKRYHMVNQQFYNFHICTYKARCESHEKIALKFKKKLEKKVFEKKAKKFHFGNACTIPEPTDVTVFLFY